MRYDLILDFETFGVNESSCPIINCAAYVFDWDRFKVEPYTFEEITKNAILFKLDVQDQIKNYNRVVEPDSLKFWEEQDSITKKQCLPSKHDLTLKDFVYEFELFLKNSEKISYWWSRNNAFDPPILRNAFRSAANIHVLNEYLPHWALQDTKTHINAKFDFCEKDDFVPVSDTEKWETMFRKHNSIHDIAADIMRLQAIKRAELDLDMVKE